MKIWVKLLIGTLIGVTAGFFLPQDNQQVLSALAWLEELALRIGRYALTPMIIFSFTLAVYELRQEGKFWPMTLRLFLMMAGSAVFVIAAGIGATILFPPARIPILVEEQLETVSLGAKENLLSLFPANMLSVPVRDGIYILPVCVFCFFIGMGLSYDKIQTKPVVSLIDSVSRVFYHIYSFFSEILGFIMVVLAAYWSVRFSAALRAGVFLDLVILLGIFSAVLVFGVLPLLLYFIRPKIKPWAVLYGSLGPAIAAFFSGDIYFSLPVLTRHNKENLGIRRRSGAVSLPLLASFGRAGSAMVAASAFIVIIKSYSSLGMELTDFISIGLRALAVSFLLAGHPGDGAYIALAAICLGYGHGYEAGYLILKPLAFYLAAVGTFLDIMIINFISCANARINRHMEEKNAHHFI